MKALRVTGYVLRGAGYVLRGARCGVKSRTSEEGIRKGVNHENRDYNG